MEPDVKDVSENNISTQNTILPADASSNSRLLVILIAVVCTVVVITHWPALSAAAMSFDDYQYLLENVLVQNPSLASAKQFLIEILKPTTVDGYYQPLSMISLMLDYALGGRADNLMPFHRTSLVLHTANTALIIVLLYLLFKNVWAAAAAGLLFGVHPMTVEPMPWVSERKTLLAAFFALWCLIFYVRYTKTNKMRFLTVSVGTYILALMSKPTSVPLPIMMLLMDYWPLERILKIKNQKSNLRNFINLILEKVTFFALGGIFAVITYISQSGTAGTAETAGQGVWRIPLVLCHNIIFYLHKIVWPVNLSSHYAFPNPLGLSNAAVFAGVIGTGILLVFLAISLRWTQALLIGWLIFFTAILPTMQIIGFSDVIASDKFAYLPSVGLLMIMAFFINWLWNTGRFARQRIIITIIILMLAGSEAFAARRYLTHWRDSTSLFEYMLKLTPSAAPVHDTMGVILSTQGKLDEAEKHHRRAIELKADYAEAHNNLALVLHAQNKFDEAVSHFRQALSLKPFADAHYNLGITLSEQGKLDEAISHYRRAIEMRPNFAKAYDNLGIALAQQGKLDEAISCYNQSLQISPNSAKAHNNLGFALQSQGKLDEAISHYQESLRIKPDSAEVHNNLGNALAAMGKPDDAINHYQQALEIKPDYADACYNLGNVFRLQGRLDEAVNCYRRVLELKPDDAEARHNLDKALKLQGRPNEAQK